MAKDKVPNYTDAEVALIRERAEAAGGKLNAAQTAELAAEMGKDPKSLRSKLVSMKDAETGEHLYATEAKSKASPAKVDTGPTKKELLKELESFGVDGKAFEGATKDGIKLVIGFARAEAGRVAEAA